MPSADLSNTHGGVQPEPSPLDNQEILLGTKLFVPALRPNYVDRPRLSALLDQGLDKALILISAPAGYGKTSLVCAWLRETNLPVAWISLDEADNDPIHFLQYLLTSLNKVVPTVQPEMLSALRGPRAFELLLNTLLNEIEACAIPFALVLDDFHLLVAQPVLDFLAFIIEHAPANLHVILVSRTDPQLQLSHLRVRNQMLEIRADQLSFSWEEITTFLTEAMNLDLSVTDIAALQRRTEGWIASIQLAALSLQGCDDMHAFVTAFAGSHHYIIDYLTEEVLKRLPERTRAFLLRTSILSRMCGSLCEAVVDPDATSEVSGQAMLEELERKNLFLIPLDGERHWYRFHHLFSDVLNRHLENQFPGLPAVLHLRASRWYEKNGLIPPAINHALLAGDWEQATRLIEQNGVLLLIHGAVMTVLKWIEAIEPHAQAHPWLYIFKAWGYALSGELDRVDGMLAIAEGLISSPERPQEVKVMQGTIAAARAHRSNLLGESHQAAEFARQALQVLPDGDLVSLSLRAVSTSLLGDATSLTGDLEEARRAYLESARLCQAAGDIHLTIVINSNLANIMVEQGKLHQAERVYSETLSIATRPDGQKALITGRLLVELSQVYYEWNRLEDAWQYAQQSLILCRQWGNMDLQAVGYAQLARLEHLRSHAQEAQIAAQTAEQLANEYDLAPRYSIWVRSALANLAIRQGNLEHASQLIQQSGIDYRSKSGDTQIPYLHEPLYLVGSRLLLAQRKYDHALRLCQRLLHNAEADDRTGRLIEILVLQALIHQEKKAHEQALSSIGRALALAEPEGFERLFLDEGQPMTQLLYQAKAHRVNDSYLPVLLSHLEPGAVETNPSIQLLHEPLTRRELELLKLIEEGCTNQDIADRLVISIPTVKRHISNIYLKLGAKNRAQAISLGKALNLFD